MSQNNGIIRIGKKGLKKFAFGDEDAPNGPPFEVDVVITFERWLVIDDQFRPIERDEKGERNIPRAEMPAYTNASAVFVEELRGDIAKSQEGYQPVTTAEAMDFMARLREEYDALLVFFQPKLRQEPESQGTSEVEMRFSVEGQTQN